MTEPLEDRPVSLPRRRPQPSPDERIDPVDPTPVPQQQFSSKPVRARKREIVLPLSTRISQEVQDILDDAVESNGITVRQAVEDAIRSHWGTHR